MLKEQVAKFLVEEMTFIEMKSEEFHSSYRFDLHSEELLDPKVNEPLDLVANIFNEDPEMGLRIHLNIRVAAISEELQIDAMSINVFNGFIKDADDLVVLFEMTGLNRVHEASLRDDYDVSEVFEKVIGIKVEDKTAMEIIGELKEDMTKDLVEANIFLMEASMNGESLSDTTKDMIRHEMKESLAGVSHDEIHHLYHRTDSFLYSMMEHELEEEDDFDTDEHDPFCSCVEYDGLDEAETLMIRRLSETQENFLENTQEAIRYLTQAFLSEEDQEESLEKAYEHEITTIIGAGVTEHLPLRIYEVYQFACVLKGINMEEEPFYVSFLKEQLTKMELLIHDTMGEEEDSYSEARSELYVYINGGEDPQGDAEKALDFLRRYEVEDIDVDSLTELEDMVHSCIDLDYPTDSIEQIRAILADFVDEEE